MDNFRGLLEFHNTQCLASGAGNEDTVHSPEKVGGSGMCTCSLLFLRTIRLDQGFTLLLITMTLTAWRNDVHFMIILCLVF